MAAMLQCFLMLLGRRLAARGTVYPTTSSTGRQLGFERDYNYHTSFGICYIFMH